MCGLRSNARLVLIVALALLLAGPGAAGCGRDRAPAPSPVALPVAPAEGQTLAAGLGVGEPVLVTAQEAPAGGGTVTVERAGDPLDGLVLEVPPGAYPAGTVIEISHRPILSLPASVDLQPLSPLITIDTAGAQPAEPVTLRIPIAAPPETFALPYYYDPHTGRLDGMVLLGRDETSVTVAATHFSEVLVNGRDLAERLPYITTDFRHGVDDWQFVNRGSIAAPKGHCAGQSLLAMLYYVEMKQGRGRPALYGLYDNDGNPYHRTPKLWQDDVLAYRLCSVAQVRADWDSPARARWYALQDKRGAEFTHDTFIETLLTTGEPQYVSIYRTVEEGQREGHAMIVYGQSDRLAADGTRESVLHISDPNYPAAAPGAPGREIVYRYDTQSFLPYMSGPNAEDLGHAYPSIYYMNKTDLLDWIDMLEILGDLDAYRSEQPEFPEYHLVVEERPATNRRVDVPLVDGYTTTAERIAVRAVGQGFEPELRVYAEDGTPWRGATTGQLLSPSERQNVERLLREGLPLTWRHSGPERVSNVALQPGLNRVGFQVDGARVTSTDGQVEFSSFRYVGFRWVNVYRESEEPTPTPTATATATPTATPAARATLAAQQVAFLPEDCACPATHRLTERVLSLVARPERDGLYCKYQNATSCGVETSTIDIRTLPDVAQAEERYARRRDNIILNLSAESMEIVHEVELASRYTRVARYNNDTAELRAATCPHAPSQFVWRAERALIYRETVLWIHLASTLVSDLDDALGQLDAGEACAKAAVDRAVGAP